MKVIDSAGWLEFLAGGPLAAVYRPLILAQSEVVTPTIVLYEVFKHAARILGEESAGAAATQMLKTTVVPLDASLALLAAELSAKHKLAMADAIVYATAQHYDAIVVTSDKHFEGLPGVEFIPKPGAQDL